MAETPVLLASLVDTNAGDKATTGTMQKGDLILVAVQFTGATAPTLTMTDNQGGTYTLVTSVGFTSSTGWIGLFVRNEIPAANASTTFTAGTTVVNTGGGLAVLRVPNQHTGGANAIKQSATGAAVGGSSIPTATFAAAPNTIDTLIGIVGLAGVPTVTPRAGWSELIDTGYATPAGGVEVMAIAGGETATVIDWGSSISGQKSTIVAELRDQYAPGTPTTDVVLMGQSGHGEAGAAASRTVTATPAVGDLLLVGLVNNASSQPDPTVTDNQGGTYTKVCEYIRTSTLLIYLYVRDQLVTSAVSTIITATYGTTSTNAMTAFRIPASGNAGMAAIRQQSGVTSTPAGTTPLVTMPGAITNADTMLCGITGNDTVVPVVPSGYTRIFESTIIGNTALFQFCVKERALGTGTTVTYGAAYNSVAGVFAAQINLQAAAKPRSQIIMF